MALGCAGAAGADDAGGWAGAAAAADDADGWAGAGAGADGGANASFRHPPPGFHRDPAGSTVAAGHHHTCALRASDAAFGGIAHCWGHDVMGGVSRAPPATVFIQLSSAAAAR